MGTICKRFVTTVWKLQWKVVNMKRKTTILHKVLISLSNEELFDILYSDKYSLVTLKQTSKELNKRGIYG
jgi:hypothetical protein